MERIYKFKRKKTHTPTPGYELKKNQEYQNLTRQWRTHLLVLPCNHFHHDNPSSGVVAKLLFFSEYQLSVIIQIRSEQAEADISGSCVYISRPFQGRLFLKNSGSEQSRLTNSGNRVGFEFGSQTGVDLKFNIYHNVVIVNRTNAIKSIYILDGC
jgi:hypothetical protein